MKGSFRLEQPAAIDVDAVVVGSGAGGSCVADVLTRRGLEVLVLEEGPVSHRHARPERPLQAFTQLWRGAGLCAALGRPNVAYAEGRCVGGGTEINSGIFQRAPDDLIDAWAERYDIAEFGADALRPFFDRAAEAVNATVTHEPVGEPSDLLRRGAMRHQYEVTPLERAQRGCVGANKCAFGCATGGKQSMTETLLPAACARGAQLIAECRVLKLKRRGGRVVSLTALARGSDGGEHRVQVRAEKFFLCAGAIHTPALLQRSGIARRAGRTLRLHPTLKCVGLFEQQVRAWEHRLPLYAVTEFMPDRRLGGSFFTPGVFAMSLVDNWTNTKHFMESIDKAGIYYAMVRSAGTGRIRTVPGAREPVVTFRMTSDDWDNLSLGGRDLAQVMFAGGAKIVFPGITGHSGWTKPPDDVRLQPASTNLFTVHLFSSCPPGERRDVTIVDSFGRVHGTDNLFVADASQIPEAPGVNPQGTVMAMAYRTAEAAAGANTGAKLH